MQWLFYLSGLFAAARFGDLWVLYAGLLDVQSRLRIILDFWWTWDTSGIRLKDGWMYFYLPCVCNYLRWCTCSGQIKQLYNRVISNISKLSCLGRCNTNHLRLDYCRRPIDAINRPTNQTKQPNEQTNQRNQTNRTYQAYQTNQTTKWTNKPDIPNIHKHKPSQTQSTSQPMRSELRLLRCLWCSKHRASESQGESTFGESGCELTNCGQIGKIPSCGSLYAMYVAYQPLFHG